MKHGLTKTEKLMRNRRRAAPVYDWVASMTTALVALVVVFTFLVRVVGVDGDSMVPTLHDRDRLVLSSWGATCEHNDIVVVNRYTKPPLIKRVIGVPGDTLDIDRTGRVYRNGEALNEPYIQGVTVQRDFQGPLTVPEGYLFVMGDNRTVSLDSRSAEIGLIPEKSVLGKVLFRLWPLSDIGTVYGNLESNLNG